MVAIEFRLALFCPCEEVDEALLKLHAGLVTEHGLSAGEVSDSMANVAFAERSRDVDLRFLSEVVVHRLRYLRNRGAFVRTYVDRKGGGLCVVNGRDGRADDVVDVDEVTALLSVLEDIDIGSDAGEVGEDGKDAGVGVLRDWPGP